MYFFSPVLVRLRKYDSNEDGAIDEADDEFAGDISAFIDCLSKPFNNDKPESDDGFNLQRYGLHRAVIDPETTFGFFMIKII